MVCRIHETDRGQERLKLGGAQLQIETHIRARGRLLMDLDRDDVRACDEQGRIDGRFQPCAFIGAADRDARASR